MGATEFQRKAADAVWDAFDHGRRRFLVADEAGLGKTHVAGQVMDTLRQRQQEKNEPAIVYYFCSSQSLASDTKGKLGQKFGLIQVQACERPSLLLGFDKSKISRRNINLFCFSANLLTSRGSEEERELFKEKLGKQLDRSSFASEEAYQDAMLKCRRAAFQKIMEGPLRPNLIIVDEFHRYDSILCDQLSKAFLSEDAPPLLLMLSATPYNLYPSQQMEELDQSRTTENEGGRNEKAKKRFTRFFELLAFLLDGDAPQKAKTLNAYQSYCSAAKPDGDAMSACLKKYIYRNERLPDERNGKYRDLPEAEYFTPELLKTCREDLLLQGSKDSSRYLRLFPGIYSFPLKKATKTLKAEDENKESSFYETLAFGDQLSDRDFLFRRKEGSAVLGENGQERLRHFLRTRIMLDFNVEKAGGRRLLWMPPTHPYYAPREDSPFAKYAGFTKLLVFSGYTLVPRALAAAFSAYADECNAQDGDAEAVSLTALDSQIGDDCLDDLAGLWRCTAGESSDQLVSEMAPKCAGPAKDLDWTPERTAKYALASPLVCAYRLIQNREAARRIAEAFNAYFTKDGIRRAAGGQGIQDEDDLLDYCVQGNLQALLEEYFFCMGGVTAANLETLRGALLYAKPDEDAWGGPDKASQVRVFTKVSAEDWWREQKDTRESVPCLYADRLTADGEDTGAADTAQAGMGHYLAAKEAFNSPFWPMMLCTTSRGQEGIDLDRYCMRIAHYSIPSNPMAFEQRDGRVDRRLSLLARRLMCKKHGGALQETGLRFWDSLFSLDQGFDGLCPMWCQLPEDTDDAGLRQERLLPFFPCSPEDVDYNILLDIKNTYRGSFGQPNERILGDSMRRLKLNNTCFKKG